MSYETPTVVPTASGRARVPMASQSRRRISTAGALRDILLTRTMHTTRHYPADGEGEVYSTGEARVTDDAIKLIQEHLDREARNRRLTTLEPRDLCPMQKARLVDDLSDMLDTRSGRRSFARTVQTLFASLIEGFRARP